MVGLKLKMVLFINHHQASDTSVPSTCVKAKFIITQVTKNSGNLLKRNKGRANNMPFIFSHRTNRTTFAKFTGHIIERYIAQRSLVRGGN